MEKPSRADDAHLHRAEAFLRVAAELRLGLVARRPAAAAVGAHRAAHRAQRLVDRNAERLRLHVPDGDVDARDRFHHHAAPAAHFDLRHAALERRLHARAVVHLLEYALGEERVFAHHLGGELVLDDGGDDRRRAERRAHAGQPAVGLDQDQRGIALHLGSAVVPVLPLRRHRVGHRDRSYTGNFHENRYFIAAARRAPARGRAGGTRSGRNRNDARCIAARLSQISMSPLRHLWR